MLIQLMKINKDVCQGYSHSMTLFNVNANQIITEWKKRGDKKKENFKK
jgi:hypothetical protein